MNKIYTLRKFVHSTMLLSFLCMGLSLQMSAQINQEEQSSQAVDEQQGSKSKRMTDEEKAELKREQAANQVLTFEVPENGLRFLNGNDCDLASTVCSSSTISFNPSNAGNNDFTGSNSDGCLSGEHLSAWYYFELDADTPPGSELDFVISPNVSSDDYDFAIWGPNVSCGSLGSPIRCSFAAPSGNTGLSPTAGDNSEGAGGDRFVNSLVVNPGDGFYLMVDNWSQSNQGFDLNWSNDGAPHLDCNAQPPCGMSVNTSNNPTICAGSIPQTISGSAVGNTGPVNYSWSANPPTAINYLSDPNASSTSVQIPAGVTNTIVYTLTASDGSGCDGDGNVIVTVTQGNPPAITPIPDMCNEEAPVSLNNIQSGIPGTWSGPGVNGNTFNPTGLSGGVTLTFTPNPGPCSDIATTVVNITTGQPPALDPIPPLCGGAGSIINLPPVQGGLQGTWSGVGVNGNQFDPEGLSGGTTLTFTPSGNCGGPASMNVTILPEQIPTLENFDPVCETGTPIFLSGQQGQYTGTWSGPGVSGDLFDPTGITGSAVITFTPDPGQCATSNDAVIILEQTVPIIIDPIGPICELEPFYFLGAQVNGVQGTWSGDGVTNGSEFNPFGLAGAVELTFTPFPGGCAEAASTIVEITSGTQINLDFINSPCGNEESINLPPNQGGVFGTWSGEGVQDNVLYPDGLSGGVVLTFTPDITACAEPATTIVPVIDPPPIELEPIDPMCSGDGPVFLSSSQNGIFGTWTGDGVDGEEFDPFGLEGNVTLTFIPDPVYCFEEGDITVEITEGEPIALDSFDPMCDGDALLELPSVQDGISGTWEGDGVDDGLFDPFGLTGGAEITFTPDPGQCAEGGPVFIEIEPSMPMELDTYGPFCDNASAFTLPASPNGITGIWSGDGVDGLEFDPFGQDLVVELTFTPDPGQCAEIATTFVDVTPGQDLFLDDIEPLCDGDAPVSLDSNPSGVTGIWSGDGVDGLEFDPFGQEGFVELTFTPDEGQCVEPTSTFVEIAPNQILDLAAFDPVCAGDAPVDLPFLQDGITGLWSGDGVASGVFDPLDQEGVIELTFTPDPGQCTEPASTIIEVTPGEIVELDNFEPICSGELVDLPFAQNGITGIWEGDGVNGDSFDAVGLEGSVELTFIPDSGQCAEQASTTIEVAAAEEAILDTFDPICASDDPIDLPFSQNGVTGIWEGSGVDGTLFDPFQQSGSIELTFIPDAGQCIAQASTSIMVDAASAPNLDSFGPYCEDAGTIALTTTQDGIEGFWSGDGVFNNEFNPLVASGSIELTFTPNDDQCAEIASTIVDIETAPFADLITNTNTCNTASAADGSTVDFSSMIVDGDTNGSWTDMNSSGVDLSNGSSVDFDGITPGVYTYSYTVASANGNCPAQTYELEVLVENCDCPSVATASPEELCNENAVLDLSTLQETDEEGTWSIASSPNGGNANLNGTIFDATNATAGTYEVVFTLNEAPFTGCPESSNQMIVVIDAVSPTLNTIDPMCSTETAISLPSVQDGITGVWSGDGINGTDFNPANLNGAITLTFTPEDGQCAIANTTVVDVTTAGSPALTALSDICPTDDPISLAIEQDGVMGSWSGDGVSANQFDPSAQTGTVELTFTPNDGQCAEVATTNINIVAGVVPNVTPLAAMCQQDTPISLATTQEGYTGTWSGDGVSANQFNPSTQTGTVELTFTPDDGQCALPATTNIEINQPITPILDALAPLCQTDVAINLPTNQDTYTGTWSGDGVSANQFIPNNQSGTIILTFTPDSGQCAEANTTAIDVGTPASATLSTNSLNTCNTSADGSILDFASLIESGDANGIWVDTDGTGVDLSDLSNVDFDGITSSQNTYTFTYTTNSATAPCTDPSYEVEVLVENCVCPSVATSAPESLCNIDGMIDLSTLQVTGETGVWSISSSPSGASTDPLNGTMFDATGADAGAYELVFTINNVQDGCPATSNQVLTVDEVIIPALTPLNDICSEASPLSLAITQDGIIGEWSGDGVENNQFNPTGLDGDILLTFTPTDGTCVQENSTMITVSNEITPILDEFPSLCDDDAAIALPVIQSNITGTWSGDGVSNDQFTPTVNQLGDIELTFTPDDGQCATINTTTINIANCQCPPIGTSAPAAPLCNESGSLDLSTLEAANSEPGTWIISATPTGSSPAVLEGTVFNAAGADEGDYEVTFTLNNPQVDCPNSETQIVTISAGIVPNLETIADLCETDAMISLATDQNGVIGNWSGDGVSNNQFTPTNQSGTMTLTFTPDAGQCAVPNTTELNVGNQPFAVLATTSLNTCNSSVDNSILNFAALIESGDANGVWQDTDGTGVDLSDLSNVDFDGIPSSQNTYTFTYTTNSAVAPCTEQAYEIEVLVENCLCPSVALGSLPAQCNDAALVDLAPVTLTSEPGTWAIISAPNGNNPATLNGTSFDGTNADAGVYTLEFTLDTPQLDCPSTNTVTIEVNEMLSAGIANPPTTICNTENTNISLADEINDEDNGGQWTETSASNSTGFDNNGSFNPFNQTAGTYTFTYTVGSATSPCPPSESTVTIIVEAAPTANAGADQIMGCTESVSLDGTASVGSTYEWINDAGDIVGTTPMITVSVHGIYTLIVRSGDCEDSDVVVVDPPTIPMEVEAGLVEPGCDGTTGSVSLSVQGGTSPYQYSINGSASGSTQFSNLEPGTYDFVVTDAMGCSTEIEVLVPEPIEVTLDLSLNSEYELSGGGYGVDLGEEVDILAIPNISLDQIQSITWSQDSICVDDCLEAILTPTETVTVSATIIDENGCSATDFVQIFVDRRPDIYPPTAFSPDKDGYNDYFMIYTGKNVVKMTTFQVFNRWGELVFENYDVQLNNSEAGWNGTFKGKDLNPDVFVWWAEFELADGTTTLMKGDVSLVK